MVGLLSEEGIAAGRFKVRRLMSELELICKQQGPHVYKQAMVEGIDIPNHLAREFVVDQPYQVWCGDITYVWTGQVWSYLAVVLDLYARRVVGWAMSARADAELVVKALDQAWEQRGRPEKVIVPLGPAKPVRHLQVPPAALEVSHAAEHESTRKLLE
jgi:putative transposase